jgi:hypothetical protein
MIEVGLMHQMIECIQKLQALNQKLENIKQGEDKELSKNTGLDHRTQDARPMVLESVKMNLTQNMMLSTAIRLIF